MPPAAIRDLRDPMYWQHAKTIADCAGVGKRQWAFVMERFKKLQSGAIAWDAEDPPSRRGEVAGRGQTALCGTGTRRASTPSW